MCFIQQLARHLKKVMGNLFSAGNTDCELVPKNKRPIIGILSVDCDGHFADYGKSYIAASYVKFIESGGARVVPIRNDLPEEELQSLINSINGVIFPGGGASLSDSAYFRAGKMIYDLVIQDNHSDRENEKDPLFVWGACLGFEMLHVIISELTNDEMLESCDAENYSIPLEFTAEAYKSRMFGSSRDRDRVMKILKEQAVTINMHQKCVTPQKFYANKNTVGFFDILSTNKDRKGVEFISTVEGKKYPVYGTQWHPEKCQFEWTPKEEIDHSPDAVFVAQYMANFFVNQARRNTNHFPSEEAEEKALIYNYKPVDTSKISSFEQCYFF